jgi:hypothetical protein
MLYEVAPETALHDRLICDVPDAVAERPVGAAGGVQPPPPDGVTDRQAEGAEAHDSLPLGWALTW